MQPMLGLSRRLLVQDETDLTKTLEEGWQKLREEKTEEALQIFSKAIKDYPEDPRPHIYCCIANEILGKKMEAKDNYKKADHYRKKHKGNYHDKSLRKLKLQNLRTWKPIGWRNRGDPEGQTESEGTDFLISFQTKDGDFNNKALKKLSEPDVYFQKKEEKKKGHSTFDRVLVAV